MKYLGIGLFPGLISKNNTIKSLFIILKATSRYYYPINILIKECWTSPNTTTVLWNKWELGLFLRILSDCDH